MNKKVMLNHLKWSKNDLECVLSFGLKIHTFYEIDKVITYDKIINYQYLINGINIHHSWFFTEKELKEYLFNNKLENVINE